MLGFDAFVGFVVTWNYRISTCRSRCCNCVYSLGFTTAWYSSQSRQRYVKNTKYLGTCFVLVPREIRQSLATTVKAFGPRTELSQ